MPDIERNGVALHYEVEGEGKPILFQTGGAGDLDVWRLAGYTEPLRADHRLILMDHRGQGKSGHPQGRASHGIREYLDDIAAVLDDANVQRAAFLGASSGATMGYAFAEAYPDRLTALIDLDGVRVDCTGEAAQKAILEFIQDVRTRGWPALVEEMASAEGLPISDPVIQKISCVDVEMGCLFELALAESGLQEPVTVLEHLKLPCLVLLNSRRASENSKELERILKAARGRARILEGAGHLRACFESGRTLPHIREFLGTVGA